MKQHSSRLLHTCALLFLLASGVPVYADNSEHTPTEGDVRKLHAEAEQGNAEAQFRLAYMYDVGQGVTQDYANAVKWYQRAAEQGNADAQTNLGRMYWGGEGVPQDYSRAVKWFRKAAEQGKVGAESNLGNALMSGLGVPQDYEEAAKWNMKAAEQGASIAQWNLGASYFNGQGVPRDFVKAYVWMSLAADQDIAQASVSRDKIAQQLTPEQKAEAERQLQEKKATVQPASNLFRSP